NAHLSVDELVRLLKVSSMQLAGTLDVNGAARLDARTHYAVDGTLNSKALSVRTGATNVADMSIYAPFHADPFLISVDGLRLSALGGSLAAKLFIENLQRLSVEGNLRNFSLPVLVAAFTGKNLGYDGTINGSITGRGDLKAKGTSGYRAETRLDIVPGQ